MTLTAIRPFLHNEAPGGIVLPVGLAIKREILTGWAVLAMQPRAAAGPARARELDGIPGG